MDQKEEEEAVSASVTLLLPMSDTNTVVCECRVDRLCDAAATVQATLMSESTEDLPRVALLLRQNPSLRVEVEGHVDFGQPEAAAKRLSQERADTIVSKLVDLGVSSKRLSAVGYGHTRPRYVLLVYRSPRDTAYWACDVTHSHVSLHLPLTHKHTISLQ